MEKYLLREYDMADIFIAYSHADKKLVTDLAKALGGNGWDVFWDERIGPEAFGEVIEREIERAKVMIVVWTPASVPATWPKSEAARAQKLGRPIFHLRTDGVELPLPYNLKNAMDFTGWRGDCAALDFRKLVQAIERVIGGAQVIRWPCFFRSVSSHECFLEPLDAVGAFKIADPMPILMSAFDLCHNREAGALYNEMKTLHDDSYLVMLDSGDYESKRKGVDFRWEDYKNTLSNASDAFDFAVCHDIYSRSLRPETIVKEIATGFRRDAEIVPEKKFVPVVHLPEGKGSPVDRVSEIFSLLADELKPPLIAIPERELGDGILERAKQIWRVRSALAQLDRHQPIHILGTGNPLSMAILALSGADSFDGLEWCRTTVDFQTARLHHAQQFDFFAFQSIFAEDEGIRRALSNSKFSFLDRVALHNLAFFGEWVDRISENEQKGWLESYLPPGGYDDLRRELPEVFL